MAPMFSGFVRFREGFQPRPGISHVVFDFDGTLSLVREGWPEVMLPMFEEMIPRRDDESREALRQGLLDDIMRLTGKQTVYQMIQFAERVTERGGQAREPQWYKHEYLRRLHERIASRHERLRARSGDPDQFLVHGTRSLLEDLKRRGLSLYLASGTDEPFVREEARLLELDEFFGDRIYGAQEDHRTFSKKMVIARILKEHSIPGANLLAFGDGYVEIENTVEVGGLAVAVASDEARNGSGQVDPWKEERLWNVGAQVAVADFRDAAVLMQCLLGEAAIPPASDQRQSPKAG